MSVFPKTPTALLTRIAADAAGEDEAVWRELVELYQPAMRGFLLKHGAQASDVDDLVQNVFAKLVGILREGKYEKCRGRFRAYLSTLLFHELIGSVRKAQARMEHCREPLEEDLAVVEPEARAAVEREWLAECHAAAVRHILANTALAESSKNVFWELEQTGDTCETVAKRLGLSAASVRQIKSRVSRMVAALERRLLGDER